ncbi:hypothetical protein HNP33_003246 [Comamonas odontotermitis]|uniref:Uncharacterized protein n=1 Tax=Comamonas odontotermitis TaxID=379895 RepID=A0ABR6RJ00_9BURK|nr:hypothetical protein [Comamonas odontotermitis]
MQQSHTGLATSYKAVSANGFNGAANENLTAIAHKTDSREDVLAQSDMQLGLESRPIDKKEMGGGLKKALEIFGNVASALLVFVPGAGVAALVGNIGRIVATAAARAGLGAAAKEGAKAGAREVAKEVSKDFGKELAKKAANETAKEGFKEGANQALQEAKTNNSEQRFKNEVTYRV